MRGKLQFVLFIALRSISADAEETGKVFVDKEVDHHCGHLEKNKPGYLTRKNKHCYLTAHIAAFFFVFCSYISDM